MNEEYDKIGIQRNWPGYEVLEVLGRGAYGKVYKIRRKYLGETLFSAVKVIHIPKDEDETYMLQSEGMTQLEIEQYYENEVQTFLRENAVMERLKSSTNIVTTEGCIVEQNVEEQGYTIYIKMELLESFENLMRTYELDVDDIATIGIDICNALMDCEQKQIVHRDIKPANVFITEFGAFKLGDFGVARQMNHTQTNMTQIGTSMYMAPELYREGKADRRVDIYSLGIMLYRLGNGGRFPFVDLGTTRPAVRQEALLRRLKGEDLPLPSNVDEELGKIILKACEHDPEQRYASAKELKRDLEYWKFKKEFMENGLFNSTLINWEPPTNGRIDFGTNDNMAYLKKVHVGDIIKFGSYMQNSINNVKEEIEWIVLDKKGEKLLIISKYALDGEPYNEEQVNVTWETCTLRKWLNNNFYKEAFSIEEQEKIQKTKILPENNEDYATDAGKETQDKIFLLSIQEANMYFNSSDERQCIPTEYAKAKGVYIKEVKNVCWWWLRSPGSSNTRAAVVYGNENIGTYGGNISNSYNAVRPALWIKV